MQRVAADWLFDPQTAVVQLVASSELTLASFKTPALEEAASKTVGCSSVPHSHGLLLGLQKNSL